MRPPLKRPSSRMLLVLATLAGGVLQGCATTPPSSFGLSDAGEETLRQDAATRGPLVVIRFPSRVTPAALPRYTELYNQRGFVNIFYDPPAAAVVVPWNGLNSDKPPRDMQGAETEALSKTAYLAMALYRDLATRLPPGSVRLMPTEIDLHAETRQDGVAEMGNGWYAPLVERTTTEYPPAPLYMDVFAYVNPYWRTGEPTTFGSYVAPLVTIRTAAAAAPATRGAVSIPDAFMPYTRATAPDAPAERGRGVTFVEYLDATQGVPADGETLPREHVGTSPAQLPGSVVVLPVTQFGLADQGGDQAAARSRLLGAYGQIAVAALNRTDRQAALAADRRRYVALFDAPLAGRLAHGTTTAADGERLALLRQFEDAEWRLLGLEDDDFLRATYDGSWGQAMAAVRASEEQVRLKLERARQDSENAAMVQAMAGGMANLRMTQANPRMGLQAALDNVQLAMTLNQQQRADNAQLAGVAQEFVARLDGVNRDSVGFVFTVSGQSVALQARSLGELRARMRQIYLRRPGQVRA